MSNLSFNIRNFRAALNDNYILILTSNSVEKDAVSRVMAKPRHAEINVPNRGSRIGLIGDRLTIHINGDSGGSSELSVGRIVTRLMLDAKFPKPALIILAGFCWGAPGKADVGDVIFSTTVCSLNRQRLQEADIIYGSREFNSVIGLEEHLFRQFRDRCETSDQRFLLGPLGSLEAHIASSNWRDALLKQQPKIVGGEMESYQFLPDVAEIPWIVIKAVSDLAGDLTSRDMQEIVAQKAARAVEKFVTFASERELIPRPLSTPEAILLTDAVIGDTIVVNAAIADAYGLNDHLNDVVGPWVDLKLRRHSSDLAMGENFAGLFCDLILEVAQNAIRHGKARQVEMVFTETKITIRDDGVPFEIVDLHGTRGGAQAFIAVKEAYLDQGAVDLSPGDLARKKHNKYVFQLRKVNEMLQRAKRDCRADILPNTIRAPIPAPDILEYDSKCAAIYVWAGSIRMSSRVLDVVAAVRDTIEKGGPRVFLACESHTQAARFRGLLSDFSEGQVSIFVEPSIGQVDQSLRQKDAKW